MIINPMFFYLMQVSDNIGLAMMAGGPILSISSIFIFMFMLAGESFIDKKTEESLFRLGKFMILAGIVIFLVGLLIPNKDTLLLMQAARLATTENVNSVFEALKAAMDYAVTILE